MLDRERQRLRRAGVAARLRRIERVVAGERVVGAARGRHGADDRRAHELWAPRHAPVGGAKDEAADECAEAVDDGVAVPGVGEIDAVDGRWAERGDALPAPARL